MKLFKKSVYLCLSILCICTGCSVGISHSDNASSLATGNTRNILPTNTANTIGESHDYQKDIIYFLFVDRFYDGNRTNNNGNNNLQYSADKTDWKKYFGGDIEGLNSKLDYLKEMGITSIWVTPLVDSIDSLTNAGDAPYHGYWGKDFFNIDEHLGTWSHFHALVSKMHSDSYNMKLILDYAPNHSNPNDEADYGSLYKTFYNTQGYPIQRIKLTDYLSDISGNWYHRLGGIGDGEWDDNYYCRYKNLFNLADFNQDNANTYAYLADGLEFWLRKGVDAVRLDAVKHMNTSFTTNLVTDMKNRLNKDIFFFGEWMDAGAWATGLNTQGQYFANHSGCSLLDFGYRSTIENVLKNTATMRTLASYLSDRETYWDNPLKQVVFLDNHDMPRINTVLRHDAGMTESYAAARTDLGLAITMTIRGVPCIYYGTEHYAANFTTNAFNQVGSDPYNREMMPSFATDTQAFSIIKTLSALRQTNAALQNGSYVEKWVDDTMLVYERKSGTDAVVVIANKGNARTQSVAYLSLPNGIYTNVLGNDTVTVENGTASFTIQENQVIVLASKAAIQDLCVHVCKNNITNWSNFNCYYWNADGYSSSNTWPGNTMQNEGNNWYKFAIPHASSSNVIFTNGQQQTIDLTRMQEGWFVPSGWDNGKITGTWYNTKPF